MGPAGIVGRSIVNTIRDTATGRTTCAARARRVFRLPLAPRLLSLFSLIILAGTTVIMIALAVLVFPKQWKLGLLVMACAGFVGALTGYVWRDLRGKWGLRVVLNANAVTLDPRANYVRSLVLSAQGRIDDAEQAIQRVLSLYPNQPRALQRLGFLRLQQGHPEEVAAPVTLSLRLNPLDAEQVSLGHFTLGMAEFHLHHDDAAYEHMRQATISSPQNGFAFQWLAAIDALHGRTEQARMNLIEYQKRIAGHTISSLRASEPSRHPAFWQERNRFYEGLKIAGLPQ
jgi:tetratricopeptide (TPR) repeat protein